MHNGNAWNQRFRYEPKRQDVWDLSHATWFFAMGVGGALFLNELLFGVGIGKWFGFSAADILGLALISIGGLLLIADLGMPLRFLRAIANLRHSWISWGFLADVVFMVAGLIVLFFGGPAWVRWIGGIAALYVVMYPGFAMATSPAIPFWNTPLIPLQFLAFAHASAAALAMGIGGGGRSAAIVCLAASTFTLLLTVLHLVGAKQQRGTALMAAAELAVAPGFLAALALGVALPLVLAGLELGGIALGGPVWIAVALAAMVANWAIKLAVLRVGIYAPLFGD